MQIFGCIAFSGALTWGWIRLDAQQTEAQQVFRSAALSRQLIAQAESLVLSAKTQGVHDPIEWAVGFLAQGNDPKAFRAVRYHAETGAAPVSYRLDPGKHQFEFSKVIAPEDGSGIRLQLSLDYVGFLGAHNQFFSDLFSVLSFVFFFQLGLFLTAPLLRSDGEDFRSLRELALDWARDTKAQLVQLGVHLRETVREAQSLAIAAGKSRNTVGDLRDRIHAEIRRVRDARKTLKDTGMGLNQAEVLTLNLVLECARMGAPGKKVGAMAEDLHRVVQGLKQMLEYADKDTGTVELGLEPMATDADLAYHAYDEVFKNTQVMDGHIRKTTETMLAQAKLIQTINGRLAKARSPKSA